MFCCAQKARKTQTAEGRRALLRRGELRGHAGEVALEQALPVREVRAELQLLIPELGDFLAGRGSAASRRRRNAQCGFCVPSGRRALRCSSSSSAASSARVLSAALSSRRPADTDLGTRSLEEKKEKEEETHLYFTQF